MHSSRGGRGAKPWSGTGTYENRYRALNLESEGDAWQDVDNSKGKNKRQRRSTGGTYDCHEQDRGPGPSYRGQGSQYQIMSKDDFRDLSTDEKLVTMFEALTEIGSLHGRVQNVERKVEKLESSNMAQNERLKLVEYKSIDMEARSRRNNLIFRGHPENVENDDCVAIVRRFLQKWLGLNPDMCIQRAHRIGNVNRMRRSRGGKISNQPRPIIVNFRDYEDVELILENAKKLKDTSFGINRDYPKEIISARSKLWPAFKKAREENPKGNVYIGYPAKLIVNKRVVIDQFPDWRKVLNGSRIQENQAVIPIPNETHKSVKSSRKNEHAAVVPKNSQGPKKLFVEIGDENEDDDSADEVASMASARSRSRSKSRSRSGSRSTSSSDRLRRCIRDELITATVKTSNTESSKKSSGAGGSSNDKARDDKSVNHEPVEQIEHEGEAPQNNEHSKCKKTKN